MDLTPMLIGGSWRTAKTGRTEDVISPYDGSVVGTVPMAGPDDVEAALSAAEHGAVRWRRTPAHERMQILLRAASSPTIEPVRSPAPSAPRPERRSLRRRRGLPLRGDHPARGIRGHPAVRRLASARCEPGNRSGQDRLHTSAAVRRRCRDFTLQYPALLVLHKVAPALAAGNSVVLKPARTTPLTALHWPHVSSRPDCPRECFRFSPVPAVSWATCWSQIRGCAKVSFTGSTAIGEHITRAAGVKKLSLELGASCPVIIMPDADLDLAASAVAAGGYVNAARSASQCSASSPIQR